MKKSVFLAATATASLAITGAFPVGAAMASPAAPVPVDSAPCPSGITICLYGSAGFTGLTEYVVVPSNVMNDCSWQRPEGIGSIVNKSNISFRAYSSQNCSGTPIATIYARSANDNLGPTGGRVHSIDPN